MFKKEIFYLDVFILLPVRMGFEKKFNRNNLLIELIFLYILPYF